MMLQMYSASYHSCCVHVPLTFSPLSVPCRRPWSAAQRSKTIISFSMWVDSEDIHRKRVIVWDIQQGEKGKEISRARRGDKSQFHGHVPIFWSMIETQEKRNVRQKYVRIFSRWLCVSHTANGLAQHLIIEPIDWISLSSKSLKLWLIQPWARYMVLGR